MIRYIYYETINENGRLKSNKLKLTREEFISRTGGWTPESTNARITIPLD